LIGAADILAILSGSLVGLSLALIGGGGSILATPALLYVVGVADAHAAIGTSALAVSANAFANLANHWRRGNVHWPSASIFAAAGVAGAAIGASVGKATDAQILLPLFAVLMVIVGVMMLRPRVSTAHAEIVMNRRTVLRLVGIGAAVGFVSGFFGIGGGFLIVPGLIAAAGLGMMQAIGSSLLSVGAQGATTAVSYAADGLVDWRIAGLFIAGGIFGGLVGAGLGARLAKERGALQKVFAGVVFVTAAYMLYRSFFR
jgi:uncharacterized membrane protein YfcA